MSVTETLGAIDQTLVQAITATIETTINAALVYDPASRQKIAQLQDILAIESSIPAMCFYIHGQEEGVRVFSYCEAPISTHLKGSPLALMSLLRQPSSLAKSGVTLAGSTQLLQQWQAILHTLDIDWEDAISHVLGDIAGPMASESIKSSAHYIKEQLVEQKRLITEYLSEERKVTPSKAEAEYLFEQIDELKFGVDRAGARIAALMAKAQANNDEAEK